MDRTLPVRAAAADWPAAKSIIDRRCVVCHACYDSPCQANFAAYEGLARGANKDKVYDASRLIASEPSRLFIDAHSTPEWRARGFFPVFNERTPTAEANREASVLHRLLELKRANPLPPGTVLSDKLFAFGRDGDYQCPTIEEMPRFETQYPQSGMPYALPGMSNSEFETLSRWIEAGAPANSPDPLTETEANLVASWEQFLNGSDPKSRLVSRYIFEHLFLADLYFEGVAPQRYFHLVRSRTAPGQPVQQIATRRPYDDPGIDRVFYRLEPMHTTVLAKTHMPYALNDATLRRWEKLFFSTPFKVDTVPGYDPEIASNPFVVFQAIPLPTRYRFMLDDAHFYIMGFIKGPVCNGPVAVNAIDDRFWIFFVNPELMHGAETEEFLAQQSRHLRLPAEEGSTSLALTPWIKYSILQREYSEARVKFLSAAAKTHKITLDLIWDGERRNSNAALTVFRHFDSATVVKGLIGGPPKTALLISYSLLERIHYLLTAGFDVHGNLGHQLNTRLYMDFLRMEGEFNFLALLPQRVRIAERDYWYRKAPDEVRDYINKEFSRLNADSAIRYVTQNPKQELFQYAMERLNPVLDHTHDLDMEPAGTVKTQLLRLAQTTGRAATQMPEASILSIVENEKDSGSGKVFSILRNSAHFNVAQLFAEELRRAPDEDSITVASGIIGAYPNAFFRVTQAQLAQFVDAVAALNSNESYAALATQFGIRRTDARFWENSDAVLEAYAKNEPVDSGLLDYSRLENR